MTAAAGNRKFTVNIPGEANVRAGRQVAGDGNGIIFVERDVVRLPTLRVVLDHGRAADVERTVDVHAAALVGRRVAADRAAGHVERAAVVDVHAAAGFGAVAGDRSAGHRERATVVDEHAAAAGQIVSAGDPAVAVRAAVRKR